ncbi:SRPBCC domain-containing protein [Pelolinea submarina]|uniref:Activator of Hsp90 ATPase-like protein n=1 Tax=Pelolinea submarina TaxID=913107 RepID=A0A347ZPW9_9CHLR|nr:SRPBCC domain-containing protein [Pelolinea submarina]REG04635.1 activator of Hsp90 ATPase-like protein [Pelolinea submarina]BBB47350.1 hypothetical protein Pelsub_P0577 [Pelolinea submarina]
MLTEQVGLTADSGWQVGVRKTLPIAPEKAWDFLLSQKIIRIWLGIIPAFPLQVGSNFNLNDNTQVKITVLKPGSHLRLSYHVPGYERPSIIQVRTIPSGENTVFAFHQEQLPDREARQERKYYFQQVLDDFEFLLNLADRE